MMRHLALAAVLVSTVVGDGVPLGSVPRQELRRNVAAVESAWLELPQFTSAWLVTRTALSKALLAGESDTIQRELDRQVALVLMINPESQVKVQLGSAKVSLDLGWPVGVLVKVINEAGVVSQLHAQAIEGEGLTARFFEFTSNDAQHTLTRRLSGRRVEYQLLLLRSTAVGQRKMELAFGLGPGTPGPGSRGTVRLQVETGRGSVGFLTDRSRPIFLRGSKSIRDDQAQWRLRKNDLIASFVAVAGPMQPGRQEANRDIQIQHEETFGRVIRRSITYRSSDSDRVPAIVLLPRQRQGKVPAMLCLHQTTKIGKEEPAGQGGKMNLHYALELAERGYVTISPDYPGFGDATHCNPYQLGYRSATAKGIVNHRAALDVLQAMPEVDPDRLGCIGHSLGGHNTLFVSLFDERIKVLATSCGFCSFPKYQGGNLAGWSHKGYMPRIASVYQNDPRQMPFDFTEILAALAPRAVFINAPEKDDNFAIAGVQACVAAAQPAYQLLGNARDLVLEHPVAGHDFPPEIREKCYRFFDRYLRDRAASK